MENLIEKLKGDIIEQLNLKQFTPADINENDPLFGAGLGLDSIDALEIIIMMEKNYGVKIQNADEGKKVLSSIKTIADYIQLKKA
jgi:acyl carrier protein